LRTLATNYRSSITTDPKPEAVGELLKDIGDFGNIKRLI
jgi:hypothetical protein